MLIENKMTSLLTIQKHDRFSITNTASHIEQVNNKILLVSPITINLDKSLFHHLGNCYIIGVLAIHSLQNQFL